MGTPFQGTLDGTDGGTTPKVRIRLDADTADLLLGGGGRGGDLKLRDDKDTVKIRLDAGGAEKLAGAEVVSETILLSGETGTITAGIQGRAGSVILKDASNKKKVTLSGLGSVSVGDGATDDFIWLQTKNGKPRIHFDAGDGSAWLGGYGVNGQLLLTSQGTEGSQDPARATVKMNGEDGTIRLRAHTKDDDGKPKERILFDAGAGNIWLGGNDEHGDLMLLRSATTGADRNDTDKATVRLNAGNATLWLGGNETNGDLMLLPADAKGPEVHVTDNATILMQAKTGNVKLSNAHEGKLVSRIELEPENANIRLGGNHKHGDLMIFDADTLDNDRDSDHATVWVKGETGDIILRNADCAEDFDVSETDDVEPGTVMVLDQEGRLQLSRQSYDKKVAGVISGAGDYRPGIILDKKRSHTKRMALALMGKVYCKVDAEYSPIEVGDLLTTSQTVGHAMKASDPLHAFGAVIGKALRPLATGRGLIPILVALQ